MFEIISGFWKVFCIGREDVFEKYWRKRAKKYGRRSVLNLSHPDRDFDAVTRRQKELIFPLLKLELSGKEQNLLDFGCGPGRFSNDLAELLGVNVIGVDITDELLNIAPVSENVVYKKITKGTLPFANEVFDVVWACLVLGGIDNKEIEYSISEVCRILKEGGLFFFIENTSSAKNSDYWFYRDCESYVRLARFCMPNVVGQYEDLGETITIFSGRKNLTNYG